MRRKQLALNKKVKKDKMKSRMAAFTAAAPWFGFTAAAQSSVPGSPARITVNRQVRGTDFVDKGPAPTGSPTYPLDVLAAFSGDRKKFLVSVVNPTEDGHILSPMMGGIKLRERGKLYQIAPSNVNSANEAGKEPVVKIDETEQVRFPDTMQVPPVSVSLYEFEVET